MDDSDRSLFEDAPCGYLVTDGAGQILRCNRTMRTWLGTDQAPIGRRFDSLLAPGSRIYWLSHCSQVLSLRDEVDQVIVDLAREDGGRRTVMISAEAHGRHDQRRMRLVATAADDRVLYERALRSAREREYAARERTERLRRVTEALAATTDPAEVGVTVLEEALASVPDAVGAVMLPDDEGWRVVARHPANSAQGPPAEMLALIDRGAADAELVDRDGHLLTPMHADGRTCGVLWIRPPPGTDLDHEDRSLIASCAVQGGQALERGRLFAALTDLADTDPLTGLPNRRAWEALVQREFARARRSGRPLCVGMIDLDHFKRFNDARGHLAGDALLRDAAASWQESLRQGDVLARYGGEEFSLLLIDCDLQEALHCTDRLRSCVPSGVTCSAGLTECDPAERPDAALARADTALYSAKRAGRDRVVVAPATTE